MHFDRRVQVLSASRSANVVQLSALQVVLVGWCLQSACLEPRAAPSFVLLMLGFDEVPL